MVCRCMAPAARHTALQLTIFGMAGSSVLEAVLQQEGLLSDDIAAELSLVSTRAACVFSPPPPLMSHMDRAEGTGPRSAASVQTCWAAQQKGAV